MITKDRRKLINFIVFICALLIMSVPIAKIIMLTENLPTISVTHNGYNEVRDYVSFRLTHLIIDGVNPYSVDILDDTNVPFMLLYSGLNPLLVAIVCKITGMSVMAGYYVVNIILDLMTALNVWLIIRNYITFNKSTAVIFTIVNCVTFFSLFGLPIFNFHTDTIGIYLTSIIFLIAYEKKELTLTLAILSVFLIFTKQILIVMAIPLFIYYLIIDKNLAKKFFIQGVVSGIITFSIIQILFPLYWTETIYAQFFVSQNYGNLSTAIHNIIGFYYRYFPCVLIILMGAIVGIILRNKGCKFTIPSFINSFISEDEYAVYLVLNIILGNISLLYFAKCGDDGYKYCQDILAPSVFILAMYIWYKYLFQVIKQSGRASFRVETIMTLTVCLASAITYSHFGVNFYSRDDVKNYVELDTIISEHEGENLYLGMNATNYMLNRNLWESGQICFNDGQIEYFNADCPNNAIINKFFYNEEIKNAANSYVLKVNEMVVNKEFGLIATCIDSVIDTSLLNENYYLYTTLGIKTDTNGVFEVSVWLPK